MEYRLKYQQETKHSDLVYRLFKKHWNKGYATEAVSVCVEYEFQNLGMTEIIARSMKGNIAFIEVMKK